MIVRAVETVQCQNDWRHNHLIREYEGLEGGWYTDHTCEPIEDDEGGEG